MKDTLTKDFEDEEVLEDSASSVAAPVPDPFAISEDDAVFASEDVFAGEETDFDPVGLETAPPDFIEKDAPSFDEIFANGSSDIFEKDIKNVAVLKKDDTESSFADENVFTNSEKALDPFAADNSIDDDFVFGSMVPEEEMEFSSKEYNAAPPDFMEENDPPSFDKLFGDVSDDIFEKDVEKKFLGNETVLVPETTARTETTTKSEEDILSFIGTKNPNKTNNTPPPSVDDVLQYLLSQTDDNNEKSSIDKEDSPDTNLNIVPDISDLIHEDAVDLSALSFSDGAESEVDILHLFDSINSGEPYHDQWIMSPTAPLFRLPEKIHEKIIEVTGPDKKDENKTIEIETESDPDAQLLQEMMLASIETPEKFSGKEGKELAPDSLTIFPRFITRILFIQFRYRFYQTVFLREGHLGIAQTFGSFDSMIFTALVSISAFVESDDWENSFFVGSLPGTGVSNNKEVSYNIEWLMHEEAYMYARFLPDLIQELKEANQQSLVRMIEHFRDTSAVRFGYLATLFNRYMENSLHIETSGKQAWICLACGSPVFDNRAPEKCEFCESDGKGFIRLNTFGSILEEKCFKEA